MKISQAGIDLIKEFEGMRLIAYLCSAGVPTIGYGSTIVNGKPVKLGQTCSVKQAEEYLKYDLEKFERQVSRLVTVGLKQHQFDALVSFTYNCGVGNFAKSTLLKMINANQFDEAAGQFIRWNKAAGRELAGLTRRREAERVLFNGVIA